MNRLSYIAGPLVLAIVASNLSGCVNKAVNAFTVDNATTINGGDKDVPGLFGPFNLDTDCMPDAVLDAEVPESGAAAAATPTQSSEKPDDSGVFRRCSKPTYRMLSLEFYGSIPTDEARAASSATQPTGTAPAGYEGDIVPFSAGTGAAEVGGATPSDAAEKTIPLKTVKRNRFQQHLLWRSNQVCEKHLAGIAAISATTNFALSGVSTALDAGATIVGGPLAKSILAGLAGVTNATRSQFNEDFYQKVIASVIVKKIVAERDVKMQQIQRHQRDNVFAYTLDDAIRDADEYHQRCSFFFGLMALASDKPTKTPQEALDDEIANSSKLMDSLYIKIQGVKDNENFKKELQKALDLEAKHYQDLVKQRTQTQ